MVFSMPSHFLNTTCSPQWDWYSLSPCAMVVLGAHSSSISRKAKQSQITYDTMCLLSSCLCNKIEEITIEDEDVESAVVVLLPNSFKLRNKKIWIGRRKWTGYWIEYLYFDRNCFVLTHMIVMNGLNCERIQFNLISEKLKVEDFILRTIKQTNKHTKTHPISSQTDHFTPDDSFDFMKLNTLLDAIKSVCMITNNLSAATNMN